MNKNALCHCGSRLQYKYCHIAFEPRKRSVTIPLSKSDRIFALVDLTNDFTNHSSSLQLPLKLFCKDNNFYFFGLSVTLGQAEELHEKLKKQILTKDDFLNAFKQLFESAAMMYLEDSCKRWDVFKKREANLKEAFKLHYEKRYLSSIPLLIIQFEGMLRDMGGIKNTDPVCGVIPIKIWEENAAFFLEDDARHFNTFTNKLFEGQKGSDEFNRNPILHGFNINYNSEENSILMILAILEIRTFLLHKEVFIDNDENNFLMIVQRAILNSCEGDLKGLIGKQTIHEGCAIDIFQFP